MSRRAPNNKVDVVLGAQWGDEGKGKNRAVFFDQKLKIFKKAGENFEEVFRVK